MRYASSLLKEGRKMLHFMLPFFVFAWSARRVLQSLYFNQHFELSIPRIPEIPKTIFCTKSNYSVVLQANEDFIKYSLKPKIMTLVTFILNFIALNFFNFSSFKKR